METKTGKLLTMVTFYLVCMCLLFERKSQFWERVLCRSLTLINSIQRLFSGCGKSCSIGCISAIERVEKTKCNMRNMFGCNNVSDINFLSWHSQYRLMGWLDWREMRDDVDSVPQMRVWSWEKGRQERTRRHWIVTWMVDNPFLTSDEKAQIHAVTGCLGWQEWF